MHQVKKGKQWYFGMKAHVGVIHTGVARAADVSDVAILLDLLHGEETECGVMAPIKGRRK
jgi:transposase, IS5 family